MVKLSFKHGGKKYEGEFDFKALCIVNEKHNDPEIKGPIMTCSDAVDFMFKDAPLEELSPGKRANLCLECWQAYTEALNDGSKND